MTLPQQTPGTLLWQQLVDAERRYYAAKMALVEARSILAKSDADLYDLIRRGLCTVPERGTALRLLSTLDEDIRRKLFPILIDLASVGHADIKLVREVILSIDVHWLEENISAQVERVLRESDTYEEYRRLAELLRLMRSPSLSMLVDRAASSADPDVREVAKDFQA